MWKYSPEIRQAAIEMYAEGIRVEDICDVLDVSSSSVAEWAKQAGVERKKLYRKKEDPPIAGPDWIEWFKTEWNEVCKMIMRSLKSTKSKQIIDLTEEMN